MWFKSFCSTSLIFLSLLSFPFTAHAQVNSRPVEVNSLTLYDVYLRYSEEFGLTGCSPLGNSETLVCLGWVGDALTTCLQWGEIRAIAACVRQVPQQANRPSFPFEFHQGNDVLPMPTDYDWGYRFNLTIP
jgi:hypothetical protein